jgi:glycerophosphoryl diester phosphodiesterase
MVRLPSRAALLVLLVAASSPITAQGGARPGPRQLIAHRGASGYAPEHTFASYQLALDQKADFVEPDLAISKDGVLICLHDDTLERTTNVEEVYPDRYSRESTGRGGARQWIANDFTVAEIKQLDAGTWRDPKFAGARVPTWEEMVALVRGKAGVYPELKSPPLYTTRGVDMEQIFVASVKKLGLDSAQSLRSTPVIIQSFDEASVRRVAADLPTIPRVFLTSSEADLSDARLRELATFASGIAPEKRLIEAHPDMVARAHALGLTVTSWTFSATEKTKYGTVKDEMAQYLYTWGVDALFTNNPDQFPRR